MKADEFKAGKYPMIKPGSPEAKRIYINTLGCNAREIKTVTAKLTEAGYEVETDNTLSFGAVPQVKHAVLAKNEALAVAKILKDSGWDAPVRKEQMLNAGDFRIIVFLVDTSGLMDFWIKEARRNVEELEEDARKLPQLLRMPVQDFIDKKGNIMLDDFNTHDESAWDALAMLQKIANIHLKLLGGTSKREKTYFGRH
jgi:hypothetical protein